MNKFSFNLQSAFLLVGGTRAGPSRGTCGLCDCTGPPRARGPQISITLIWIYRPKLHPLADNSPPHISIPIKTPYGAAAAMHPALQACGPALPVLLSSGLKKLWTAPKSKLPVRIWAPATLFGPLGSCHLAGPSHPMNFVFFNAFSLVIEYWLLHWSFASVILCSNFKGHLKSMMLFSSENFARIQAICTIIIIIVIIYIILLCWSKHSMSGYYFILTHKFSLGLN